MQKLPRSSGSSGTMKWRWCCCCCSCEQTTTVGSRTRSAEHDELHSPIHLAANTLSTYHRSSWTNDERSCFFFSSPLVFLLKQKHALTIESKSTAQQSTGQKWGTRQRERELFVSGHSGRYFRVDWVGLSLNNNSSSRWCETTRDYGYTQW